MDSISFSDIAIVSCGALRLELNHLRDTGFLDARQVWYTPPGLHETPRELERQLLNQIAKAKDMANKVIVVYGGKFCYVNADEPTRTMKTMIEEQGPPREEALRKRGLRYFKKERRVEEGAARNISQEREQI